MLSLMCVSREEEMGGEGIVLEFLLRSKCGVRNDRDRDFPIQQSNQNPPFRSLRLEKHTFTFQHVTSKPQRTGKAFIRRTATDKASKE